MAEVRLAAAVPATFITAAEFADLTREIAPGAIAFRFAAGDDRPRALYHRCPCGTCDLRVRLPLLPLSTNGWAWDGNREKPTLTPSIFHYTHVGPHWHGFLQAGVWIQA